MIYMTGQSMEMGGEDEFMRMAFERYLTRAQADRVISVMQATLPDATMLWQYEVDIEINTLTRRLDATYTRDESGNGWLVLSRLNNVFMNPQLASEPRAGIWNVLSPLYNDRRTIAAKIERVRHSLERINGVWSVEADAELGRIADHSPFNLMDGPLASGYLLRFTQERLRAFVRRTATYRATLVAIALSAYRGEHSEYPSSLGDLVGTYLGAVPIDPFDGRPFRYIPKPAEDDFVLYAVGRDQVDDGGRPVDRRSNSPEPPQGDLVFTHARRNDLYAEIKLEKARP
jgi:hypothetical protein